MRFGLRTLLAGVALVALFCFAVVQIRIYYNSTPLTEAVASFNAKVSNHPIGKEQPPLTEEEVVRAIVSQNPHVDGSDSAKSIFARVARTRRMPENVKLVFDTTYSDGKYAYEYWGINLSVDVGDYPQYLSIRATEGKRSGIMRSWIIENRGYDPLAGQIESLKSPSTR